jgi:predicted TIM-barrel fold metal-dependent hydrolase
VFDAHSHAFPDALAPHAIKSLAGGAHWHPVEPHHDGTVAGLLAGMDHAGIERAIMCSIATRPSQVRKITDWSAAIASDRLIPFASIHPDFENPEAEIERIAALGLRGLKFHPQYMACPADDPRVLRIARAAAKLGLALALHTGYDLAFACNDIGSPRRIRALHQAVPSLRLLACHLGGWEDWDQALRCVIGLPIYIETSFCLGQCPPATLERIITRHPPDMLLWGTDSPWADQAADLQKFRALPFLSDQAKASALWENPSRFVGFVDREDREPPARG